MKQMGVKSVDLCGNTVQIARQYGKEVGYGRAITTELHCECMSKCITHSVLIFLIVWNETAGVISLTLHCLPSVFGTKKMSQKSTFCIRCSNRYAGWYVLHTIGQRLLLYGNTQTRCVLQEMPKLVWNSLMLSASQNIVHMSFQDFTTLNFWTLGKPLCRSYVDCL